MIRNHICTWIAFGGLLIAVSLPLAAQAPQAEKKPESAPKAEAQAEATAASPSSQGMSVVRDPLTGEFRAPDAAEAAILSRGAASANSKSVNRSANAAALEPQPFAAKTIGGIGVRVDESTMAYSVAKIGPDGKLVYECVTGEQAANKTLATPAAPVAKKKEAPLEVQ